MFNLCHLSFYTLMMVFLSLWVHRSAWLWGAFLIISYILAFNTGVVQPFSIIPIGLLFVLFLVFRRPLIPNTRFLLILITILIGAGLNFHWIPGFSNWNVSENLWINFDKPFMGLFALAFLIPLLRTPEEWYRMALKAAPMTLVTVLILAMLALPSGTIDWQLKIPSHFLVRLVSNLFLVSVPEEAFFRGFVQAEIFKGFGPGPKGHICAVVGASLLFTLFHIGWTASAAMLGFVFLAGLFYGAIFQITKAIEASIICHFSVNLLHMTFFTYHAE
jgi:membrane protease YdiL (CAAX protease family)